MTSKGSLLPKISQYFLNKFRVTLLIVLGVILFGYVAYTTLINKQGFPAASVPLVLINGSYQVNDINRVDKEITSELEGIVRELDIVNGVNSTTSANTFNLSVNLNSGTEVDKGLEIVEKQIKNNFKSPENLSLNIFTVKAGKYYGEFDVVVNLYSKNNDSKDLQKQAELLEERLNEVKGLVKAEVIPLTATRTDVATGQPVEIQTSFNKVGVDQNGNGLKFFNTISVGLIKKESVSVLEFSDALNQEINSISSEEEFKDYSITTALDFAPGLRDQLSSLETNFLGAMITLAIVVLILINLRASIVVLIFIPLIVCASIVTLYLFDISLNIISLFSLILVLGLFVDNVIVVVEAVDQYKLKGQSRRESLVNAIKDVGPAYVVGTVANILVFVPMLFISGILGEFIRLIPITVIISASLSVILTLTVVAALSAVLIKPRKTKNSKIFSLKNLPNLGGDLANKLGEKMGDFVRYYLRKKWLAALLLISSILAIIYGASFASKLEFSVFPQASDTNELKVEIVSPEGTSIQDAMRIADEVNSKLEQYDSFIKRVVYENGNSRGATMILELIKMEERKETSQQLKSQIQNTLNELQDARISVDVVSVGPPTDSFPFKLQIYDQDKEDLIKVTDEVKKFLEKQEATNQKGEVVKFKDIEIDNISTLAKNDGRRYASIQASFDDNEKADTLIVQSIQKKVSDEFTKEKLAYLGITSKDAIGTDLGFESENLESFESTFVALIIALLVMYIVLVAQYNSYSLPLLIFSAIPFSFPGLFPGLYLTENPLSFFVSLGIIALAGIVVNNTIVLIDFANTYLEETGSIREAISRAIAMRFRPILVSSLTTIVGLLPLGLSDPFWEGLSFTIVFGFASSTILVLLVFPVYYTMFQVVRRWMKNTFGKLLHH